MTVKVHVENVFPTPIYLSHVDVNDVNIDDVICVENGPKGIVMLSDTDLLLENAKYNSLKHQIDEHMRNFYHNILGYGLETYPEMSSSWLVKSIPGMNSSWHLHGNAIFSGVVYLKAEINSGNLSFQKEMDMILPLQPPIANSTLYNTRICSFPPDRGVIVLFPSTIYHKVETNKSDEDRISIGFNYFIKGKFSERTAKLRLS